MICHMVRNSKEKTGAGSTAGMMEWVGGVSEPHCLPEALCPLLSLFLGIPCDSHTQRAAVTAQLFCRNPFPLPENDQPHVPMEKSLSSAQAHSS